MSETLEDGIKRWKVKRKSALVVCLNERTRSTQVSSGFQTRRMALAWPFRPDESRLAFGSLKKRWWGGATAPPSLRLDQKCALANEAGARVG